MVIKVLDKIKKELSAVFNELLSIEIRCIDNYRYIANNK